VRARPPQTVRDNLGHASLATTSIYSTGELARRYREIEVLVE
jgi:site-specific recombinase XerC